MDAIKEAMIREEDTGEHDPALDPYRVAQDTKQPKNPTIEALEALARTFPEKCGKRPPMPAHIKPAVRS